MSCCQGCQDGAAKFWDAVAGGPALVTLQGHSGWVTSVCFNHDGTRLATGSRDGMAKIWDAVTGKELHSCRQGTRSLSKVMADAVCAVDGV